jgi:hypothetical protein
MRGVRVRRIRLGVLSLDCQYNTLAQERSEIGQFNNRLTPPTNLTYVCSQSHFCGTSGVIFLSPTPPSSFFFSGEAADVPYGAVRQ